MATRTSKGGRPVAARVVPITADQLQITVTAPPLLERILCAVVAAEDDTREEFIERALLFEIGVEMENHNIGGGLWPGSDEPNQSSAVYVLRVVARGGTAEEARFALEEYQRRMGDKDPFNKQPPALEEIRRMMATRPVGVEA